MKKKSLAVVLALFAATFVFTQTSAEARGRHAKKYVHHATHHVTKRVHANARTYQHRRYKAHRATRRHAARLAAYGGRSAGRPARWCGWWLGQHLGMPRRDLWIARNWASVGSNAGRPSVGVVVVWRNHVGIITGRVGSQWIVKSGNDGRAVRERPRSISGAIAFRHIGGGANI